MKRYFHSIVIAATLLVSDAYAADRVALVIGQAKYQAAPALPQAAADADAIVSTLQQLGFETIEVTDAMRSSISEALARFADSAAGAQIAVLYYSGYSIPMGQDDLLLPIDATPSSDVRIRLDAISLRDAITVSSRAKTRVVFVNTASNNPFLSALKPLTESARTDVGLVPDKDEVADLFISKAQTLTPGVDDPSVYAVAAIEALGQHDEDLSTALTAMTTKIDGVNAGKAMSYGRIPAGLRLDAVLEASYPPAGDPAAHFNQLGDAYRDGKEREKNPTMALGMYLKAASYGSHERAAAIAEMYDIGSGTPKDSEKATEWYLKAGAEGEYQIARRYEFGTGIPRNLFDGQTVVSNPTPSNFAKAMVWYSRAAEHGYARAQWQLGNIYRFGNGIKENETLATEWYLKAADNGYVPAMYSLGAAYRRLGRLPEDVNKSRYWYTNAAERGHMLSMLALAEIESESPSPNYRDAEKWYEKAAETDSIFAKVELGSFYMKGWGGRPNYSKALKWYKKAADLGDGEAMNKIGLMYGTGQGVARDYSQAGSWYEKAAAHGFTYANFNLAILFSRGLGCRKNIGLAVQLAELAVRKNEDARNDLKSGWSKWTPEFRVAFQLRLTELGLYKGAIDGRFGSGGLAALDKLAVNEY